MRDTSLILTEDDFLPDGQVLTEADFLPDTLSEADFVPEEKAARYRDIAKAITDSSVTAEVVSGITAKNIPDEDKDLFLGIVQHQARETGANQKSSYLGKMGAGFAQGAQRSLQNIADVLPVMNRAIDFAAEPVVSGFQYNDPNYPMPEPTTATRDKMPAASSPKLGVLPEKFMGYESLSPKERAYRDAILAARNTGDPLRAADDTGLPFGHFKNWPIEAAQMAPQMATGMGATAVAGPVGGIAYWATQTYPERMADLVKSGIDEKIAGPYALVDAALEGAVEMFEPFPGTSKLTGAAKAGIRAKIREFGVQWAKETSEEGVQGFLEEATKYVTSRLDPNAENSEAINLAMTPARQMAQAVMPLFGIMATSRGMQALGNVGQRDGGDTNELMSMIPPNEPTPEAPVIEEKPPIKLEITPEAKAQEEAIDAANADKRLELTPESVKSFVKKDLKRAVEIADMLHPSRSELPELGPTSSAKDRAALSKMFREVFYGDSESESGTREEAAPGRTGTKREEAAPVVEAGQAIQGNDVGVSKEVVSAVSPEVAATQLPLDNNRGKEVEAQGQGRQEGLLAQPGANAPSAVPSTGGVALPKQKRPSRVAIKDDMRGKVLDLAYKSAPLMGEPGIGEFAVGDDLESEQESSVELPKILEFPRTKQGKSWYKELRATLPLKVRSRVQYTKAVAASGSGEDAINRYGLGPVVNALEAGVDEDAGVSGRIKRFLEWVKNRDNAMSLSPADLYEVQRYRAYIESDSPEGMKKARLSKPQEFASEKMVLGDSFTVGGHKHVVTEVDPETDSLVITNGQEMRVPIGQSVFIDVGSYRKAAGEKSDVFDVSPISDAVSAASKESDEAWNALRLKLQQNEGTAFSGIDPELGAAIYKVIRADMKLGIVRFADFVKRAVSKLGYQLTRSSMDTLRKKWENARADFDGLEPAKDSIEEALKGLPSRSPNPEKRDEPQAPKPPKKSKATKGPVGPITALKKAVANVERADLGMNLLEDMKREGWQEVLDAAVGKESQAPTLVQEQILNPRALNTGEFAILLRYKAGLQKQLRDSAARMTKAIADRNNESIKGESPEFVRLQAEAAQLSAATSSLVSQFDEITRTVAGSATITARALAFMKAEIDEDFTVQSVLANFAAKKGSPLTQEEVERATKIGNDLEAAAEKKARTEAAADDLADDAVAEAEDEKAEAEEAKKPKAEPTAAQKKARKDVKTAKNEFFAKLFKLSANPDPEIFIEAIKLVKAYIRLGIVEFQEFFRQATEGVDPERAKASEEILQEAWTQVMTERRTVTDANDDYELARVAKRVLLDFARAGVRGREELWTKTFDALQESVPDLTRRRLWEALTDYGKSKPLDKEAAKVEKRQVTMQLRSLLQIEDYESGVVPPITGQRREKPDAESRRLKRLAYEAKKNAKDLVTTEGSLQTWRETTKTRLRNRLADLQLALRTRRKIERSKRTEEDTEEIKQLRDAVAADQELYDEVFGVKKMSDEQRVKVMAAALEKRIAEQERMIAENDIAVKPRKRGPTSPELEARREYSKALTLQIQELRRLAFPKMTKEQIANAAYRARLAGRWADLVTRLFRNDFSVVKKAKLKLDTESAAAAVEMDKLKKVYYDALAKYKWDKLSVIKKFGHVALGAISVSRMIQLGLEGSSVGLQGGMFTQNLWNAKKTSKHVTNMVLGLRDPVRRKRVADDIVNDPIYDYAKSVGKVAFSDPHGSSTKREEDLILLYTDKLPVLKQFAEVNSTFLNAVRLETFKQIMSSIDAASDADAVAAGKLTNMLTGRTDLGLKGNAAAPLLSLLILATRWTVSRFQVAALVPLYTGTSGTRKAAAKMYAQTLISTGLMYSLATMIALAMRKKDDDEPVTDWDPRSSHFGSIRFGNTWVSAMFGVDVAIKLMARQILGETIDRDGNIVALSNTFRPLNWFRKVPRTDKAESDARLRVVGNFLRQRIAPFPSALANLIFFDKTISGKPVTVKDELLGLVSPLTGQNIVDAIKSEGLTTSAAMSLFAVFGMKMATWFDEPGAVSDKIAKGLIKYNYRHGEKAAYVPAKPKKSYTNKAGEEVPFTDEQHEQLVRVSSELTDEFAAQRNVNFADPTDSDVEAIKESLNEAHRVATERMVEAIEAGRKPTDEELSGAVSDRMEADIVERMTVLASDKPKFGSISKPDPLTGKRKTYPERVEEWRSKQAKAKLWMKQRGVDPKTARATYMRHLYRNTKDPKDREDNFNRASRNLSR